jgi:MFS family permease
VISARYVAATAMFSLGIGLHAFNAFIASTTMPSAVVELDAVALLSWATSAYLVASIVGGAAAATLKARFGAQAVLLGASAVFVVGSFAFGTAQGIWPIVLGRVLQGAGEGVVMACCYMLIPEIFPKALLPRIFALESVVWVSAALGGPLIAGAVSEFVSWRAAVMVSVPLSFVFAALVPLCTPKGERVAGAGATLPVVQLGLIAFGVLLLSASGAFADWIVAAASAVLGMIALGLSVAADGRGSARLLPTSGFSLSNPVSAGLLLVLVITIVEAPSVVYTAFLGRTVWGLGPTVAGLLAATLAISWSVTAIAAAHLPRLTDATHIIAAPLLLAIGMMLQAVALSAGTFPLAVTAQVVMGAAFGFSWARLCEHVMAVAPSDERDIAMGAIPTIQSAGLSIGTAFVGTATAWMGLGADLHADEIVPIVVPVFAVAAVLAAAATGVARRVVP